MDHPVTGVSAKDMFEIEQAPTVNDLAKLRAEAMRRPLALESHRPQRIHVRGNPRWKELSPHLKEIGIKVVVQKNLPQVDNAYNEFVRDRKEARSGDKLKPTRRLPRGQVEFQGINRLLT